MSENRWAGRENGRLSSGHFPGLTPHTRHHGSLSSTSPSRWDGQGGSYSSPRDRVSGILWLNQLTLIFSVPKARIEVSAIFYYNAKTEALIQPVLPPCTHRDWAKPRPSSAGGPIFRGVLLRVFLEDINLAGNGVRKADFPPRVSGPRPVHQGLQ